MPLSVLVVVALCVDVVGVVVDDDDNGVIVLVIHNRPYTTFFSSCQYEHYSSAASM